MLRRHIAHFFQLVRLHAAQLIEILLISLVERATMSVPGVRLDRLLIQLDSDIIGFCRLQLFVGFVA